MEAVLFMGLQATGKSSFYQERFFRTHIRLNLDMLKTRYREDILLRACIEAKQPFVVDNTNPTPAERVKYIEIAHIGHFRVVGYYFQSSLQAALDRNQSRPEKERVPEKGILGTFARMKLPTFEEGFDALYYVRLVDHGQFQIEEWQP